MSTFHTMAMRLARAVLALGLLLPGAPALAQSVQYIHTDALGTPVAVTDADRNVLERSEYEPYGKLLNRPLTDGPGYTGHVTDATTGLSYMQQRYYDPTIGRFLSVDPVTAMDGGQQHFNRYDYAYNNPYKFTDPDGRDPANPNTEDATKDDGELKQAQSTPEITTLETITVTAPRQEAAGVGPANATNFSFGAGGVGQWFLMTVSADSGLAVDTRGNVCLYSNICMGGGPGVPIQGELGFVGSVGSGELRDGEQSSKGAYWMGGSGLAGQGQVMKGSDGLSFSRGLIGVGGSPVGAMVGAGLMTCSTIYVCGN